MEENNSHTPSDPPLFSRCSIGKKRWYWVVGCDIDHENGGYTTPLAEGTADSPESARKAAEEQFGTVKQDPAWVAKGYRRMNAAKARMEKSSASTATTVNEFVYRCDEDYVVSHRIDKRTKNYIYVECESSVIAKPYGDWHDYSRRTFRLDRFEMERDGSARRANDYETFYADPSIYYAERNLATRPQCLITLNVSRDSSPAEIKAAYRRLAKKTHPDAGGAPEDFKAIQNAYEDALNLCSQ